MNNKKCMCACHLLDHDGVMRSLMVPWRCVDCGAEPDPRDGEPYGVIRRHVLDNGGVEYIDTTGVEGDIGVFLDLHRRRVADAKPPHTIGRPEPRSIRANDLRDTPTEDLEE
jgi:hypothetical protein